MTIEYEEYFKKFIDVIGATETNHTSLEKIG